MPYDAQHPLYEAPEPSQTIRRYMNLPRFLSLLQTGSLFFSKGRTLQAIDPFEGRDTLLALELKRFIMSAKYADMSPEQWKERFGIESETTLETWQTVLPMDGYSEQYCQDHAFINCWSMDDDDSDALWKLYTNLKEGVAIQSTFADMCHVFNECKAALVGIGKIKYVDTKTHLVQRMYVHGNFLHKRKSFAHEKELRAIFLAAELKDKEGVRFAPAGAYLKVNLQALISSVWLPPLAEEWIVELVRDVMNKYGLGDKPLTKSPLYSYPSHLVPPLPTGPVFARR